MVGDIIAFTPKGPERENLITDRPVEFRQGDWQGGHAMLCTRRESERYEVHRKEALGSEGHHRIRYVPNHFRLDGGYHFTVMGLFRYRTDEERMRRVYRLAGLMECVTSASSPILRTDLLRRFYKDILDEREDLQVVWRGNVHHFLLPLHSDYYNPNHFGHAVGSASTLKELFEAIGAETNKQFDIISIHYVVYLPESFLGPLAG